MTHMFIALCQIALAKVLMKGHDCLAGYSAFEMKVYEDDGIFTLVFTAKDHMDGYDCFGIDLHTTESAEEMIEWLSNTRVSTRRINTLISENLEAEELSEELSHEVTEEALNLGLLPKNEKGIPVWTEATIPSGSFFELWVNDVIHYGHASFHNLTLKRVKHYRKLWDKYNEKHALC